MTDPFWITLISLAVTGLFMLGVPVFLVIAYWVIGCSIVLGLTFDNIGAALTYAFSNGFALLAMPLFILTGDVLVRTGLSRKFLDVAEALTCWAKGGFGSATVLVCGMFAAIDIRLVDFKLEFGRIWDGEYSRVILADEISPDGCRLWDMNSGEKLDKDRFRRDLGGEEEAYQEVARRLGVLQNDGNTPGEVFDLSAHRGRKRGSTPKKK